MVSKAAREIQAIASVISRALHKLRVPTRAEKGQQKTGARALAIMVIKEERKEDRMKSKSIFNQYSCYGTKQFQQKAGEQFKPSKRS
jgi:hypothetical protein